MEKTDKRERIMAVYLPGMLRTRTRGLPDFPKEHRSHHVLVELFRGGALERGIEQGEARGRKRELACAL